MAYLKYFLMVFLVFSVSTALLGFFEYKIAGPYAEENLFTPFYDMFLSESSEGGVKVSLPIFDESDDAEEGGIWDTIVNTVTWNYVIFDSGVGLWFRYIVLGAVGAAFLFCLGLMMLPLVIPWFRPG